MLKKIFSCVWFRWNRLLSRIFVRKAELDPSQEFVLLVDEARKEWQWASGLTREFKENDLIDSWRFFGEQISLSTYYRAKRFVRTVNTWKESIH